MTADVRPRLPSRDFIPVELVVAQHAGVPEAESVPAFMALEPADAWEPPTSLFGDAER